MGKLIEREGERMIIQGSNAPLILEFDDDMTNIVDFSAVLYVYDEAQKKWDKQSVDISGTQVMLKMTQEETMGFDTGKATLECKYSRDGLVYVTELANISISQRLDKEVLTLEN